MRRMKQKQKNTHTAYHLFMLEALAVSLLCIVTCGNDEFLERPNSRNTDANRWQLFKQILSYLFWNSTKHCLPPKISSLFVPFLRCCCHITITASASVSVSVSAVIFKSLHSFYFCFFSSLYCSLSLRLINTLPKFIYTQNHPCSLLHNKWIKHNFRIKSQVIFWVGTQETQRRHDDTERHSVYDRERSIVNIYGPRVEAKKKPIYGP